MKTINPIPTTGASVSCIEVSFATTIFTTSSTAEPAAATRAKFLLKFAFAETPSPMSKNATPESIPPVTFRPNDPAYKAPAAAPVLPPAMAA